MAHIFQGTRQTPKKMRNATIIPAYRKIDDVPLVYYEYRYDTLFECHRTERKNIDVFVLMYARYTPANGNNNNSSTANDSTYTHTFEALILIWEWFGIIFFIFVRLASYLQVKLLIKYVSQNSFIILVCVQR